jgi:drug/metabolite transporter (DMT)-like permease
MVPVRAKAIDSAPLRKGPLAQARGIGYAKRLCSGALVTGFVLALVLFGALLHASWNALLKAQADMVSATALVAVGTGVVALPVMLALPLPAAAALPYLIASALIHVGYFALVGYAYRAADLGAAYPLSRGSAPVVTALLAFLLIGEALAWSAWVAIGAIAAGIVALSADALLRGGLTMRAGAAALINGGVIVAYTLIDGLGARAAGNGVAYGAWMIAGTGALIAVFALAARGRAALAAARAGWPLALIAGALVLGSYGIALWAMTIAPIGLVASLRETSVLFAAILGAYFFGEPFGPKRWVALALIVGGIVALRL